jgi:citrate lyase gamma subunit
MRRSLQLGLAVLLLLIGARAQTSVVVDRLVAIVNNTAILQSDWEVALRCEAIMDGRAPESLTATEQKEVFSRLVDQELIREQMRGYAITPVTDSDIDLHIKEVRQQIPAATTDKQWQSLLQQYGIAESDVRAKVKGQLEILRFLDARMRPLVRVEFRSIRDYYRDHYVPDMQRQHVQPAPLADVSDQIRELITQQRMDEQINAWVQTLRYGADIRVPKDGDGEAQVMQSKE